MARVGSSTVEGDVPVSDAERLRHRAPAMIDLPSLGTLFCRSDMGPTIKRDSFAFLASSN
jgi:hypothetical protein